MKYLLYYYVYNTIILKKIEHILQQDSILKSRNEVSLSISSILFSPIEQQTFIKFLSR